MTDQKIIKLKMGEQVNIRPIGAEPTSLEAVKVEVVEPGVMYTFAPFHPDAVHIATIGDGGSYDVPGDNWEPLVAKLAGEDGVVQEGQDPETALYRIVGVDAAARSITIRLSPGAETFDTPPLAAYQEED